MPLFEETRFELATSIELLQKLKQQIGKFMSSGRKKELNQRINTQVKKLALSKNVEVKSEEISCAEVDLNISDLEDFWTSNVKNKYMSINLTDFSSGKNSSTKKASIEKQLLSTTTFSNSRPLASSNLLSHCSFKKVRQTIDLSSSDKQKQDQSYSAKINDDDSPIIELA